MPFCQHCGQELADGTAFCPNCGAEQNNYSQPSVNTQPVNNQQPYPQYSPYPTQQPVTDSGSIGWACLGYCIPIVGLILFIVWKDTKPKSAKAAGIGALVSFVLAILFYFVVFSAGFFSM